MSAESSDDAADLVSSQDGDRWRSLRLIHSHSSNFYSLWHSPMTYSPQLSPGSLFFPLLFERMLRPHLLLLTAGHGLTGTSTANLGARSRPTADRRGVEERDFFFADNLEPHATRRKEILKAHPAAWSCTEVGDAGDAGRHGRCLLKVGRTRIVRHLEEAP